MKELREAMRETGDVSVRRVICNCLTLGVKLAEKGGSQSVYRSVCVGIFSDL